MRNRHYLAFAIASLALIACEATSLRPRTRPALAPAEQAGEDLSTAQQAWLKEHDPWGLPKYMHACSHTVLVSQLHGPTEWSGFLQAIQPATNA